MRKIIFITIFSVFIMLTIVNSVSAFAIDINIDIKEIFILGEEIEFSYSMLSDASTKIAFIAHVDCPRAPTPFIQEEDIVLRAGKPYNPIYNSGLIVQDFIEPQTCIAYIEILEPIQKRVEKEFKIATDPSFELSVFSCKDKECQEKSKVFVLGETAYFNYTAEVEEPEITGKLTEPDGAAKDITLPDNFVLGQTGKYILEIEAKKQDYKVNRQSLEIVVLAEQPKAIDKRICNANGVCEQAQGETFQNCPQDCLSPSITSAIEAEKPNKKPIPIIFFLVIPTLVMLALIGYLISKIKSGQEIQ